MFLKFTSCNSFLLRFFPLFFSPILSPIFSPILSLFSPVLFPYSFRLFFFVPPGFLPIVAPKFPQFDSPHFSPFLPQLFPPQNFPRKKWIKRNKQEKRNSLVMIFPCIFPC